MSRPNPASWLGRGAKKANKVKYREGDTRNPALEEIRRRPFVVRPPEPKGFKVPPPFQRIFDKKGSLAEHYQSLRESKSYRLDVGRCILQGEKLVREHLLKGYPIHTLGVTILPRPNERAEGISLEVLNDPSKWPANEYKVADIHVTRKIVGTASKPADDEIWAEVPLPVKNLPGLKSNSAHPFSLPRKFKHTGAYEALIQNAEPLPNPHKLLAMIGISDPGNVGTIIRTASAFGFDGALTNPITADLFNEKVIRASRGAVIGFPSHVTSAEKMISYASKMHELPSEDPKDSQMMQLIVADMIPEELIPQIISRPESGVVFWREKKDEDHITYEIVNEDEILPRFTILMSSDHHGLTPETRELLPPDQTIFAGVPMPGGMESLNVAAAAAIIMYEMSRIRSRHVKEDYKKPIAAKLSSSTANTSTAS